jgi:hypothetical protein
MKQLAALLDSRPRFFSDARLIPLWEVFHRFENRTKALIHLHRLLEAEFFGNESVSQEDRPIGVCRGARIVCDHNGRLLEFVA